MRTFTRTLIIVLVVVLLGALVAVPVIAQESETLYQEGIQVEHYIARRPVIGTTYIKIVAVKYVDDSGSYTEVSIESRRFGGSTVPFDTEEATINTTVRLPGDPDELEVSNDLGWGGLNGTVWVQETVEVCLGTECTTTVRTVPVTIHLSVFTFGAVEYDGTHYTRGQLFNPFVHGQPNSSGVYGSVTFPQGQSFGSSEMFFGGAFGSTFSTRAPFPDE